MARVLADYERSLKGPLAVNRWMRHRQYLRLEDFYFETLDDFSRLIRSRSESGELNPLALVQLLAVMLREDRSVSEWFRERLHSSTLLQTAEGWTQLYKVAAGAVVERYLRQDRHIDVTPNPIPTTDALRQEIAEVLQLAVERGRIAEDQARGANEVLLTADYLPDLTEMAEKELERILTSEVLLAVPADPGFEIPRDEAEREIGKRALMHLRRGELRELAQSLSLSASGRVEQLVDRIARRLDVDHTEIARQVLLYELPQPERGIVTRLIALGEPPDLPQVSERIEPYIGRYVLIYVARWLVFTDLHAENDYLDISGKLKYYRVEPKLEYDEYALSSTLRESDVRLRLRRNVRWAEVNVKRGSDTRSVGRALQTAAAVEAEEVLPMAVQAPEGEMVSWDRVSVFMLDFLNHYLRDGTVQVANMTVAQFESAEDDSSIRGPAISWNLCKENNFPELPKFPLKRPPCIEQLYLLSAC